MDRPRFEDDERIDRPDIDALSALADRGERNVGHAIGKPQEDETDGSFTIGCTLKPSTITFGVPNLTVNLGLVVMVGTETTAVATTLVGDGAPNGDVLTLAANTVVPGNSSPTVGSPIRYLMVRPTALTAAANAQRVFYQFAAPKEVTNNIDTRLNRYATDFIVVDSWALAKAEIPNGYQLVARVNWNMGVPVADIWYSPFPQITNAADYPVGHLSSVTQAINALAFELARIKGGAWAWDAGLAPGVDLATFSTDITSIESSIKAHPRVVSIATLAFNGAVAPTDGGAAGESYNFDAATLARTGVGAYTFSYLNPITYVGNLPFSFSFTPYNGAAPFFGAIAETWQYAGVTGLAGVAIYLRLWSGGNWIAADPAAGAKLTMTVTAIDTTL